MPARTPSLRLVPLFSVVDLSCEVTMKGLWRTTLVAGLALAVLAVGAPAAAPFVQDKTKRIDPEVEKLFELPAALSRPAPDSVSDLKAIQDHVKKVIKKVTPSVVGIQ